VAATASDIRRLENAIQRTERDTREVDGRIGEALNPSFLLSQNARFNLQLRPVEQPQVVRVQESLPERLALKREGVLPVFAPVNTGIAEAPTPGPAFRR
jgi:hypothetical protein